MGALTADFIQDVLLLVPLVHLLAYLLVQVHEISLGQAVVCEESLHLVVDVAGDRGLVSVLELELVDKHAFELLSLLYFHESLPPRVGHSGLLRSSSHFA